MEPQSLIISVDICDNKFSKLEKRDVKILLNISQGCQFDYRLPSYLYLYVRNKFVATKYNSHFKLFKQVIRYISIVELKKAIYELSCQAIRYKLFEKGELFDKVILLEYHNRKNDILNNSLSSSVSIENKMFFSYKVCFEVDVRFNKEYDSRRLAGGNKDDYNAREYVSFDKVSEEEMLHWGNHSDKIEHKNFGKFGNDAKVIQWTQDREDFLIRVSKQFDVLSLRLSDFKNSFNDEEIDLLINQNLLLK